MKKDPKEEWRRAQEVIVCTVDNHFCQSNGWSGGCPWSKIRRLPLEQMKKYHCVGWGRAYGGDVRIYSLDPNLRPWRAPTQSVGRNIRQAIPAYLWQAVEDKVATRGTLADWLLDIGRDDLAAALNAAAPDWSPPP